ncbi:hypothetical protein M8312_01805 [Sphingomonas sp. KRR8]|uniref:hypothetical protein n=1 Tax=Sphingomonas sp. KRR8 TaxID=2942996 RepID=UPI002021FB78|nr:hypothetical protein [Sphingomonas sp. KRR8]URD61274.1 hypothetical protein M8312_01805 [Sphingomonas sp. KRR8]
MRLSLLIPGLSLVMVAGCHAQTKNPADGDEKVNIQGDGNGSVSFDLPFAKGQVKLPSGMMHNANFDIDGVKLMPGSKVTGFNVDAGGDKDATVNMKFTAPGNPGEVQKYFLDQFAAKGVTARADGSGLAGTGKDGEQFTIGLAPGDGGTAGTIVIHDKNKG